MKHKLIQLFLATSVLVFSAAVVADETVGSIGKGSKKVDYYQIECYNDGNGVTELLELNIRDNDGIKANSVFSAQVLKGALAYNTTDNGSDGDTKHSPTIKIRGGDGIYHVLIGKSRVAADDYVLDYHCVTKNDKHTGTNTFPVVQNK